MDQNTKNLLKVSVKQRIRSFYEGLLSFMIIGIWISILIIWVYAINHAFEKHGTFQGMLNLVFPPAAIYYAPEGFFWHDDHSQTDWEARIATDQMNISYMLTGTYQDLSPTDRIKLEEAITLYSKQFNTYPEDKKKELQNFSIELILYSMSVQNDLIKSLSSMTSDGIIPTMKKSLNTKRIGEEFAEKYVSASEIIKDTETAIEIMNLQLSNKSRGFETPEEKLYFENLILQMRVGLSAQNKKAQDTHSRLFQTSP